MSHDRDLAADIGLWLAGESISGAADRALIGLEGNGTAQRTAAAMIVIEDVVRDWYGGMSVTPRPSVATEGLRQRRLAATTLAAVAVGLLAGLVAASSQPLNHLVDTAEAWAKAGPPLPLATTSLWHLSQQLGRP